MIDIWKDKSVEITCNNIQLKQPYVEIEVRTTLDQSATDESFAIDNVVLWKRQAYVADVIRTYSRYMMFECSEDRECNGKFGDWSNDCDNSNSKDKEKQRTYTITTDGNGIYAKCPHEDGYVEKQSCDGSSHGIRNVKFEIWHMVIVLLIFIIF